MVLQVHGPRKTAPKVKLGKAQKKNNWAETPIADYMAGTTELFRRERPAKGYRHAATKQDLERFIALLPDWEELAVGLQVILLAPGDDDCDGWCADGWVARRQDPAACGSLCPTPTTASTVGSMSGLGCRYSREAPG
jgi:hypothetical protein